MSKHIWTTKSGEKVPIRLMGDRHLLNTIRLLQRTYATNCWRTALAADAYAATAPDGAAMAAENAAAWLSDEALEQERIDEEYPIFKHLHAEAERRGLELLPIDL